MEKLVTIFIPSYNRQKSFATALASIFSAIEYANVHDLVDVLVVDDYSSDDIESTVSIYRQRGHAIEFHLHKEKCGVAEVAMLRCLQYVKTRYAWCIGNDDVMLVDALERLIPILKADSSSFFLLNFIGAKNSIPAYEYFSSADDVITFRRGVDLFRNFGFVTSTTTFPCLCFEVAPMMDLDLEEIVAISPIYSHTAAFFCAFHDAECSFVSRPLILFNHNERLDEHEKLQDKNSMFSRPALYHASVGLARHLEYLWKETGVTLSLLAGATEDEICKDTKAVKKTATGFFIFLFTIQQMRYELYEMSNHDAAIYFLGFQDLQFLRHFFADAGLTCLLPLFDKAEGIYCHQALPAQIKIDYLQVICQSAVAMEGNYIKQLYENRPASSYVVYGQQSGIKLVLDSLNEERKQPPLRFAGISRMPLRSDDYGGTSIMMCERADIADEDLPILEAIANTTRSDIVVFNNVCTTERFFEIFGPDAGKRDISEKSVWTRTDLALEQIQGLFKGRHKNFMLGAIVNARWFAIDNGKSEMPTIEFINWKSIK